MKFCSKREKYAQSLLHDYKCIVGDLGCEVGDMRSSHLKEIFVEEYGTQIGFKERAQKTQNDLVYDVAGKIIR